MPVERPAADEGLMVGPKGRGDTGQDGREELPLSTNIFYERMRYHGYPSWVGQSSGASVDVFVS